MKGSWKRGGRSFLFLLFLFILWEVLVRITQTPMWLLPAPSDVFKEAMIGFDNFYGHLLSTIYLAMLGLFIGCSIGLIISIILYRLPKVNEVLYPLLILSQNIPTIVLAPLLIIWFGFGILPKLIIISLVCFFPIVIASMDGFRQTAPELKHYMQMVGARRNQIFWKLEFPHALPSLFSGLKIAATYSVMGTVISEWLGAKSGIGVYMTLAQSSFRIDRVFVAIFFIMLLSLLLFGLIRFIEKMVVKGRKEAV
ncbi:nitrate ABC transporter permease [Ureibacillus massiliensis 4400831 = CIP 108448 = CCUG 49529]|uniref:Nitrate ABC transporter permease n=1 Tax=Ureibacillus massiliensis 4400831 = CIP 108448 = CCUG 49529 TaxID=1211035 RepID=A0A0A3J605_9BACL|nr:ABC transporter permease [Ureibacillus massiliensis]KGR92311.1 nitrate ABC transporter permease [Ureibacillus massiliensis 4400831 = CIP 108448 = CCUG 49529]